MSTKASRLTLQDRVESLCRDLDAAAGSDRLGAYDCDVIVRHLRDAIEMVVAEEREACAKVCDHLAADRGRGWDAVNAAEQLGRAIRARGSR